MLTEWLPDIMVLDAVMPGWTASRPARNCAMPGLSHAGADADRPGRRGLDQPRLRGRRHRLLRQEHAVEPAGRPPALPAALGAHPQELERSKASWPAPRIWPAWAASTGAGLASAPGVALSPESLRVFGCVPEPRGSAPPVCAWCPADERVADAPAAEVQAHEHRAGDRRASHLPDGRHAHRAPGGRARVQRTRPWLWATPASCRT
jgi:hypothetical protein